MTTKEQSIHDIKSTYAYYKKINDLNEKEENLKKYTPDIHESSTEVALKMDQLKEEKNNYIQQLKIAKSASSENTMETLPPKPNAPRQVVWDKNDAAMFKPTSFMGLLILILVVAIVLIFIIGFLLSTMMGEADTNSALSTSGVAILIAAVVYFFYKKKKITDDAINKTYGAQFTTVNTKINNKYQQELNQWQNEYNSVKSVNDQTNADHQAWLKYNPQKIEQCDQEEKALLKYHDALLENETELKNELIKNNSKLLQETIKSKNDFVENTPHLPIPARRQYDWAYYGALYEIINTGQEKDVPSAIRLLENRYQQAELNQSLRDTIDANSAKLAQTIISVGEVATNEITKSLDKQIEVAEKGFDNVSENLKNVNNSFTNATNTVLDTLDNVNAGINNINNNVAITNQSIAQNMSQLNQTVNKQIEKLDGISGGISDLGSTTVRNMNELNNTVARTNSN